MNDREALGIILLFACLVAILSLAAGYGLGYMEAARQMRTDCFDMWSKIQIEELNMDLNYTHVMDWMESRGYELGCKEHEGKT